MNLLLDRLKAWRRSRRIRQISVEGARARVARGAAYLDDVEPGWHERIDLEALAMGHGASCILGQLHGEFRQGLSRSALVHMSSAPRANLSPVSLGFLCVQGVPEEWQERDYRWLDAAWSEAVEQRRPAPGSTPPLKPIRRVPAPVV